MICLLKTKKVIEVKCIKKNEKKYFKQSNTYIVNFFN